MLAIVLITKEEARKEEREGEGEGRGVEKGKEERQGREEKGRMKWNEH